MEGKGNYTRFTANEINDQCNVILALFKPESKLKNSEETARTCDRRFKRKGREKPACVILGCWVAKARIEASS